MATFDVLLDEFRSALAAIPTSRDGAKTFIRHTTSQPFRETPVAGYDGFCVALDSWRFLQGFGQAGYRQIEAIVLVELGNAPFETEENRDGHVARDQERVADILEGRPWSAALVDGVFFESASTDKDRKEWWVTSMRFRVVFWGAVSS